MGETQWLIRGEPVPSQAPFNVYLYDGAHEHSDQLAAFTHYDSALADTFIAIIDDWWVPLLRTQPITGTALASQLQPNRSQAPR